MITCGECHVHTEDLAEDALRCSSHNIMAKRRVENSQFSPQKKHKLTDAELETSPSNSSYVEGEHDVENYFETRRGNQSDEVVQEGLPIKIGNVVKRVSRRVISIEVPSAPEEEHHLRAIPSETDEETKSPQQKLIDLKELIAEHATLLQEDPETYVESLGKLCELANSGDGLTSILAIGALVPVFKSLAPSYRIRPLTEVEKKEKVSKETARLRNFEENLLKYYRIFINRLNALCKKVFNQKEVTGGKSLLAFTALAATCELCSSSLKHFNFNTELFAVIIQVLGQKPRGDKAIGYFERCVRTIEELLREDGEQGAISLEIFRLLSAKIKRQCYRVDESVLNIFLSSSVLDNAVLRANSHEDERYPKPEKKKRVHLSKKQRKARKDAREIEEEMRKAEQAITQKQREKFQAEMLKLVFKLYLELLQDSLLGSATSRKLAGSVLEGLSKFGPMANVELVGDFLEVLKDLLRRIILDHGLQTSDTSSRLYHEEDLRIVLLCVATSYALICNHTENGKLPFSVDLSTFVRVLYSVLGDISLDPDLELSYRSLRLADPLGESKRDEKPAVNVSTRSELLLKCLDMIFFRSKSGTKCRALSFLKRIFMMSLHTPERTTNANFKFISKLLARYGVFLNTLWSTDEKVSEGAPFHLGYEKQSEDDIDSSNIYGAVLWENIILEKHYSLSTRKMAKSLSTMGK